MLIVPSSARRSISSYRTNSRSFDPRKFVQRDGGGIGDVEAAERVRHRDVGSDVAIFAHEPPEPRPLRAEHQYHVTRCRSFAERAVAVGGERNSPEPQPAEPLKGPRKVDHGNPRHEVKGAG